MGWKVRWTTVRLRRNTTSISSRSWLLCFRLGPVRGRQRSLLCLKTPRSATGLTWCRRTHRLRSVSKAQRQPRRKFLPFSGAWQSLRRRLKRRGPNAGPGRTTVSGLALSYATSAWYVRSRPGVRAVHHAHGCRKCLPVLTRPPPDVAEALRRRTAWRCCGRRWFSWMRAGAAGEVLLPAGPGPWDGGDGPPQVQWRHPGSPGEVGYPPRLSFDKVSARVPTQEQCTVLGLPGNLPVLPTLRAVVYSDGERPIEATVMAKAVHLYELQYELSTS
jgi:hypothetical protein